MCGVAGEGGGEMLWAGDAVGRPTATHKQRLRNTQESQLICAKLLTQICYIIIIKVDLIRVS